MYFKCLSVLNQQLKIEKNFHIQIKIATIKNIILVVQLLEFEKLEEDGFVQDTF